MSTARVLVHVNRYQSLLDKVFRYCNSSPDGAERQGSGGLGHSGQAKCGDGTTHKDGRKHFTPINFLHSFDSTLRQMNTLKTDFRGA